MKFYRCPICGNIITVLEGEIIPVRCCGKELEELIPNTKEAAFEKHIPVCKKVGDKLEVTVGEIEHPMQEEHYILFIAQVTDKNVSIVKLQPDQQPKAVFPYKENAKIYAYCNLHGLWVKE